MRQRGSAIGQAAGYGVMLGLTLLYIPLSGINKETWRGKETMTCIILVTRFLNIACASHILTEEKISCLNMQTSPQCMA